MTTRRAECSCGQLSAVCSGDPVRISVCHCFACQRRTGSAFGVAAWYAPTAVAIEGRATSFVRVGDQGSRITFRFCPVCGSTVWWENAERSDRIAIAAGAFADLALPEPNVSVYDQSRRHRWVSIETKGPLERRG